MISSSPSIPPSATPMQPRDPGSSALLTDLYQLTMLQTYYEQGMTDTAVFELFFRRLPPKARNFFVAAGLEQVVEFLEGLAFLPEELDWLGRQNRFSRATIEQLSKLRFTGEVWAVPEGTVLFANEFRDSPMRVNAVDPGPVNTPMTQGKATRQPDDGARPVVRAVMICNDGPTGCFFDERGPVPW